MPLERLKILLSSSTPIVVMETVEEMRAVRLVRAACSSLNLATFEWSIASGLVRCGSDVGELVPEPAISPPAPRATIQSGAQALYNSKEPAQALSNLEAMSLEAAFVLKDFHRHMDDPVVVRRLRDVGQKFSANRRTVDHHRAFDHHSGGTGQPGRVPRTPSAGQTAPAPDHRRDDACRVGKTRTLKRTLDAAGLDAMANNLRGLTEEEAERAASQAIVTRYGVTSETVTDVLQAKKELLRHSGMLEFIDASENLASVGGLENLKRWLAQRRGTWEDAARDFGLEPPRGSHHSRSAGLRQEHVRPRHRGRVEAAAGEVRHRRHLRQVHRRNRKANPESISRRRRTCPLRVLDRRTGERFLPEAGRIRRRSMPEFLRASWPLSFPGCRTAKRRYSLPPPATT